MFFLNCLVLDCNTDDIDVVCIIGFTGFGLAVVVGMLLLVICCIKKRKAKQAAAAVAPKSVSRNGGWSGGYGGGKAFEIIHRFFLVNCYLLDVPR